MLLANICHSHVPNLVNKWYYCTVDTVGQYFTVSQRYYTHNKYIDSEQAKYTHSFILFVDNTSRSYSPYSTLKPFLPYSFKNTRPYRYYVLFAAHKTSKIRRINEKLLHSFFDDSNTPQVLKPFRPYSLQEQDPEWIARLIDRILSIKVQAAVSVYCAPLHLTLVITSRYTGQHT